MKHRFKKFFHSLYFKLLAIYGLTFLAVLLSITAVFKVSKVENRKNIFWTNVEQYANYIVADIGIPPNIERAQELSQKLRLGFYIKGPGVEFSSLDKIRDAHSNNCAFPKGSANSGWQKCGRYHELYRDGYHYVISPSHLHSPTAVAIGLGAATVIMLLIFVLSFHWVSRIFSPVKEMQAAAQEYGKGNYQARVAVKSRDELGALGNTFNEMAKKVDTHFRSVRELLIAISHELRSPLARMKVALESISKPEVKESLNEDIKVLDQLTAHLLEKERLDTRPELIKKTQVNLQEFVQNVAKPFNSRIKVEIDGRINALLDEDRMILCLRNIIENAVKYSEEKITITAEHLEKEIKISIEDKGIGISEDDLNHITEPFFRSDPSRTGSRAQGGFGLGLSLCQSIIRAHGGRLEIQSQLGSGTTVNLLLPIT